MHAYYTKFTLCCYSCPALWHCCCSCCSSSWGLNEVSTNYKLSSKQLEPLPYKLIILSLIQCCQIMNKVHRFMNFSTCEHFICMNFSWTFCNTSWTLHELFNWRENFLLLKCLGVAQIILMIACSWWRQLRQAADLMWSPWWWAVSYNNNVIVQGSCNSTVWT